jgi:hypothetical protein
LLFCAGNCDCDAVDAKRDERCDCALLGLFGEKETRRKASESFGRDPGLEESESEAEELAEELPARRPAERELGNVARPK